MQYTIFQWLELFFFYSFLGWIWESCYVSVQKKEWVNRGFLHGPLIPIYGSGAVVVLFITFPVRTNLVEVYLAGMLAATILEYVTGAMMERLFHVRYWDYSQIPLNLNGHICLFCSLGWGVFSIAMVRLVNPPVEKLIMMIPAEAGQTVCLVLVFSVAVDTTRSVQAALHLRNMLERLSANNKILASLETKLEEAQTALGETNENFRERVARIGDSIQETYSRSVEKREAIEASGKAFLSERLAESREKKNSLMALLSVKTEIFLKETERRVEEGTEEEKSLFSGISGQIRQYRDSLRQVQQEETSRKDQEYQEALEQLRRNPSASSDFYGGTFEELRALLDGKRKNKKKHENGG
mgnify:CR=1 FL=1